MFYSMFCNKEKKQSTETFVVESKEVKLNLSFLLSYESVVLHTQQAFKSIKVKLKLNTRKAENQGCSIMLYLQRCSHNQRDPNNKSDPLFGSIYFKSVCVSVFMCSFVSFVYRRELFLPLTYRLAGAE